MTHDRRKCKSCGRLIPTKRAATYPQAILCGADKCTVLQHKRQNQRKQARWREKRIARDPGFRLRALQGCRDRYVARRLAAGKTVGPPAPWAGRANERGAIDAFLAAIRRSASGALVRAARALRGEA